jgi:hypothetical protein
METRSGAVSCRIAKAYSLTGNDVLTEIEVAHQSGAVSLSNGAFCCSAANPNAEYFELGPAGAIEVDDDGRTRVIESKRGNHRLLTVDATPERRRDSSIHRPCRRKARQGSARTVSGLRSAAAGFAVLL